MSLAICQIGRSALMVVSEKLWERKNVLSWVIANGHNIPRNIQHEKKRNKQTKVRNKLFTVITTPKVGVQNIGVHEIGGS